MAAYKFLFFDIDHTLWDFETNSVSTIRKLYDEEALVEFGITDFDDFNEVYHDINDKLWDRFRKGYLSRQDLRWKRMFQTLIHYKVSSESLAKKMSERYLEMLPTQTALFPFVHETLSYCIQQGYSMHLITNGFELTQSQKLKNAGIANYFDKMITSEMAMSMKPHKEIFEYACKMTGASPSNSLMIGDALDVDILGGMNAGIHQVYFNPKQLKHSENPTFEISCLSELMDIL